MYYYFFFFKLVTAATDHYCIFIVDYLIDDLICQNIRK